MARKKKAEEHENHERWLVSYADFITLLFAFFVVLYSISQVDIKKLQQAKKSIGATFRGADDLGDEPAARPKVEEDAWRFAPIFPNVVPKDRDGEEEGTKDPKLSELRQRLIALMAADGLDEGVRVGVNGRGLSVRIEVPMLFEPRKRQLSQAGTRRLDRLGSIATSLKRPVLIRGVTHSRSPGRLSRRFSTRAGQIASVGRYMHERYRVNIFLNADAEVGGGSEVKPAAEEIEVLFLDNGPG